MRLTTYLSMLLLAALLPLTIPTAAHAEGDDLDALQDKLTNEWRLVRNDRMRSIKTWVKQEDGKRFRSFKAEATLDGTLEAYVRVLLDFDNYKKWYWEVLEAKILHKVSATEYQFYIKHRAPYGVPNRDVPGVLKLEPQSRENRTFVIRVKAFPDLIPEAPPLVRMKAEDMLIRLTPLAGNRVFVEAEGYVDPGGRVPGWANNYIQRAAPYSILVGFLRMMENKEYLEDKRPLPFPVFNTPS